ncbi:uncharacterized protein LOC134767531 [Penaeus indicus]|uniref:uncharacterized protein LOC134767531 n=1 Tax=Penaeus indicus TaxID=29960 RepID=UPI00300D3ACE
MHQVSGRALAPKMPRKYNTQLQSTRLRVSEAALFTRLNCERIMLLDFLPRPRQSSRLRMIHRRRQVAGRGRQCSTVALPPPSVPPPTVPFCLLSAAAFSLPSRPPLRIRPTSCILTSYTQLGIR